MTADTAITASTAQVGTRVCPEDVATFAKGIDPLATFMK
jgi:hypothetical protein